jgi:hypothetical protein
MDSPIQTNLEILKEKNVQLKHLLDDPHPGLATWMMAVCKTVEDMYVQVGGEFKG